MAELLPGTAASRPTTLMRSVRDVAVTGVWGGGPAPGSHFADEEMETQRGEIAQSHETSKTSSECSGETQT